jgi:stringent starvation protein B
MPQPTLSSQRPYLVRAYFDWIIDNDLTPHIMVDADFPGAVVPRDFVRDSRIILNVAPRAVHGFELDRKEMSFNASFRGQPMRVIVPMGALLALYAQENRAGVFFEPDPFYEAQRRDALAALQLALAPTPENTDPQPPEPDPDEPPPPSTPPGRPRLRVVK